MIGAELSGGGRGNGRTLIDGEFSVPDAPDRNVPGLTVGYMRMGAWPINRGSLV